MFTRVLPWGNERMTYLNALTISSTVTQPA